MTLSLTATCVGGRRALVLNREPSFVMSVVKAARSLSRPLGLTGRECQVMESVIKTGYCTKAAEHLGISVKTVEAHMLHMRTKTGSDSNYQLIAAYVAAQVKDDQWQTT